MLRLTLNAIVNGSIGVVGLLVTQLASGQELTRTMLVGAGLTGLLVALKDIHSFLQSPPKV